MTPKRKTGARSGSKDQAAGEALSELRRALGSTPAAGLAELSTAEITYLAEALVTAKAHHSTELAAAIDKGLQRLPRLLRMPVRRILFR